MAKYILRVIDEGVDSVHYTDSSEVAECWGIFVQLIGFKYYYMVEKL